MTKLNSSYIGVREDLLKFILDKNNIVLDVGCATGENGKVMLEKGLASEVYGIEFQEEMALEASRKINKVYQGDLNNKEFRKTLISQAPQFDYIIFGDILEHLYEPEKVLKEIRQKLKTTGKVIISLPNIAHIEMFIQVYLKGVWPKNNRGIFDATHIRWFTKKDALTMVENCDLKIDNYERKLRARDAIGSTFTWKYNFIKFINKDWVTFQHIIIGSPNV